MTADLRGVLGKIAANPFHNQEKRNVGEPLVADRLVGGCLVLCQFFVLDGVAVSSQRLDQA